MPVEAASGERSASLKRPLSRTDGRSILLTVAVPDPTPRPQPNTPCGSYFSFTRRTRSRLPPQ
jgi:hypothetical protein